MRSSGRLLVGAIALLLCVGAAGCGKSKGGVVPVNNPTTKWEPPDADDIVPEDEADEADESSEE